MKKLQRPPAGARPEEVREYARELAVALDEIGVERGKSFFVVKPEDPKITDASENALGGFVAGSETSRKAALDNYPRSGTQRWRVLQSLINYGDMTREQVARMLQLPDSSVRPRIVELMEGDFIEETDETRPTQTGSEAAVLTVTEKGREESQ